MGQVLQADQLAGRREPVAPLRHRGQTHNLIGAECFLPELQADILIADKAFDAQRVLVLLAEADNAAVIPPNAGSRGAAAP